jgi:hypothetical protein
MCGIWNGPYIGLNNNYAIQPVLKVESFHLIYYNHNSPLV